MRPMLILVTAFLGCSEAKRTPEPLQRNSKEKAGKVATEPAQRITSKEGYRDVRWGMSQAEVERLASLTDGMTTTTGMVAGFKAETNYMFLNDGRLAAVVVVFNEYYPDSNDQIREYTSLSNMLEAKYGVQASEETETAEGFEDPKRWFIGVKIGKVKLSESWLTDETVIMHSLNQSDHRLQYIGRTLFAQIEAEQVMRSEQQRELHIEEL